MRTVAKLPAPQMNLPRNISWQYDQAPHLTGLIYSKQDFYNANYSYFWSNWFTSVFDLKDTPNQFGLIVWSIILGVPIELMYQIPSEKPPFGFGSGRENFRDSNFAGDPAIPLLTVDEGQRLLRMRYYAQTISPTIYNINYALKDVFGDLGTAFVQSFRGGGASIPPFGFGPYRDNFDNSNFNPNPSEQEVEPMSQVYVFQFPISAALKNALINYDILPRGSGVRSTISSP